MSAEYEKHLREPIGVIIRDAEPPPDERVSMIATINAIRQEEPVDWAQVRTSLVTKRDQGVINQVACASLRGLIQIAEMYDGQGPIDTPLRAIVAELEAYREPPAIQERRVRQQQLHAAK